MTNARFVHGCWFSRHCRLCFADPELLCCHPSLTSIPQVAAGSLNRDGVLVLRALRPAEESTPARIARLTLDAQVGC